MKASIVSALVLAALATPVAAQSVNDDVRCMLVSSGFARAAKDDNAKRASSMTGAFYLGRLYGRVSRAQIVAAIKAQGTGLSAKQAEPIMRACAARAGQAEQDMGAAARQAEGAKPPASR